MKTYEVVLTIRAENKADAEELINDYTGEQTDVSVLSVIEVKDGNDTEEADKFLKNVLGLSKEGTQ